ncbi:MAG TPA: DUF2007 domain-containing protein [Chitinophagaceae bacterium]|nr:DUF2007 domain-containing protein [Chitinophagaceae bacterium]
MDKWTKIYTTRNYTQASIIKGMLEENNIPVTVMNKLDSSYLSFGDIEVYVAKEFAALAASLINKSLMN